MTRSTGASRCPEGCGATRRSGSSDPGRRRRSAVVALTAALLAPAVGACTVGGSPNASPDSVAAAAPVASPVTLEANVAEGATVPVDTRVAVTADGGTVTDASLAFAAAPGQASTDVGGTVAPDGSSWTARELLEPGTAYTLRVTAAGKDGQTTTLQRAFTAAALSKKQQINPTLAGNGATVGIAMPVVVTFDVPVQDKASFQRHMTVTSEPAQPGAWSWISDTEARWRPVEYWQTGTKVSVDLDLNSVPGGNGTYGQRSLAGGFTVGQPVVMQADLKSHQMTVTVDGALARTIPITGGKPGFETRSGTKVIMEKFSSLKMDAATLGISRNSPEYYSIPNVRYAMRETWSGEFVHAAPWSVGSHGRANVSHGCIGMSTANAGWLYGVAKVGDPLVVTGSNRTIEKGNGWNDWDETFEQFKAGSALPT